MGWLYCFQAGGVVHAAVIASIIAVLAMVVQYCRHDEKTDARFSTLLFATWIIVALYNLRPGQIGWDHSIPLHVCDVSGLMAAFAIRTGNRFCRSILHFWGLALSPLALIVPMVQAGPAHCHFWLYFINHGGIVVAAVYDIKVRGYRPTRRDWGWATLLLSAYSAVIIPFDQIMSVDYGFLGHSNLSQRSIATAFGPWPQRLPGMWLMAVAMMALLQVRWPKRVEALSLGQLTVASVANPRGSISTTPRLTNLAA